MATKSKISEKQALDRAAEGLTQLDDQRLAELKNEKQLQEIKNEVINREAERLAAKHGTDHPRVQKLQSRSSYNKPMLTSIDTEIEKASFKPAPLPVNAWRLNGKVMDKKEQPVSEINVFFADEKGTWIRALGNSISDKTGYYALTINEDLIELAQKNKLYISASNKNQQVLYLEQNTFVPTKGIIDYQDIILGEVKSTTPPKDTTPPKATK